VSVNGASPAVLQDSLGPIEPHGESPPKLAYASDGSLYMLYVVVKLVPGRRFPAAALRFARSAGALSPISLERAAEEHPAGRASLQLARRVRKGRGWEYALGLAALFAAACSTIRRISNDAEELRLEYQPIDF
jgi:hypothetical protein